MDLLLTGFLNEAPNLSCRKHSILCPSEILCVPSIYVTGSHLRKTNTKATKSMRQFPAKLHALISITQRNIHHYKGRKSLVL